MTVYVFAGLAPEDGGPPAIDAIGLLCPTCFALVARRPLTRTQFASLLDRPIAREPRFDRSRLPYHHLLPEISAGGGAPVHETSIPLLIAGHPPLALVPPMTGDGALRIDLRLADETGAQHHLIRSNVWNDGDGGWTFFHNRSGYSIRSTRCESRFTVEFPRPDAFVIIDLVTMIEGMRVELTPQWLNIDGARLTNAIASERVIGFEL